MSHPSYIVMCSAGRTWHFNFWREVCNFFDSQDNRDDFVVYRRTSSPADLRESK